MVEHSGSVCRALDWGSLAKSLCCVLQYGLELVQHKKKGIRPA